LRRGLAFEAWEKGVLGPDRTDGLKLEWGNLEAVETLLERCARRETWLGKFSPMAPKSSPKNWVAKRRIGWFTQRRDAGAARMAPAVEPDAALNWSRAAA